MRKFKTMRAAREAYARVEESCGMPFEQWMSEEVLIDAQELDCSLRVYEFIRRYSYVPRTKEVFWMVPLDAVHKPLCMPVVVAEGLLNGVPAGAREVFRTAILWNAAAIVVAHNHPSGDSTPSRKDVRLTKEILDASRILRIPLLDHVVVGKGEWASMREDGYVEFDEKKKKKGRR